MCLTIPMCLFWLELDQCAASLQVDYRRNSLPLILCLHTWLRSYSEEIADTPAADDVLFEVTCRCPDAFRLAMCCLYRILYSVVFQSFVSAWQSGARLSRVKTRQRKSMGARELGAVVSPPGGRSIIQVLDMASTGQCRSTSDNPKMILCRIKDLAPGS